MWYPYLALFLIKSKLYFYKIKLGIWVSQKFLSRDCPCVICPSSKRPKRISPNPSPKYRDPSPFTNPCFKLCWKEADLYYHLMVWKLETFENFQKKIRYIENFYVLDLLLSRRLEFYSKILNLKKEKSKFYYDIWRPILD